MHLAKEAGRRRQRTGVGGNLLKPLAAVASHSSVVTICYLAALPMTNRKTTKKTVATPDLDPATLAHLNVLKRQRERMSRALLKRRRRKSGQ